VDIRPVLCRQERIGSAIADGISRTTNGKQIGVFSMQRGPGSENSIPGAIQSFADNVPMLMLPGGPDMARLGVSPEFFAVPHYERVTKWSAQINSVDRIPELMRRAFYNLRTGKGGPVMVELPHNVADAEYPGELKYEPVKPNRYGPDPVDVREVASALMSAKNLVIHAGQGVLYAEATDELEQLAELLQAPVMTTLPGKSGFPENHPLALGASAISTTKPISVFLARADVVFGIGTSFTRTSYGKTIPDDKVIIHSTNDPTDINKDYKADLALIGDSKLVLEALIAEINAQTNGIGNRNDDQTASEVQVVKKEWLDEWMSHFTSDETPLNQYRIIWDLMHLVDRANTIITHDAGSPRDQLVPFWESTAPRTYQGWGKTTQLGYGLGITMGAKLVEPDKLCINIMGDAAIGMVGMDFETAVRNNLGILTIVFNNGAMAIERDSMPIAIEKFGSVYVGGDYRGVAESLGGWAVRVEKPEQILPSLRQAIEITKTGKPALVEFIVKEGFDFSRYP
jgi:acetolactate synthase-1/2/3 large subunit